MLTALLFLGVTCICYALAMVKGPFWALLAYANVYFNSPDPYINWWASYLPIHNWSSISTGVLLISMFVHRDMMVKRKLKTIKWAFLFILLTYLITYISAQYAADARKYSEIMLSYGIVSFCIIKSIRNEWDFRTFWLVLIGLAGHLSLNAYLHGKRIHGRLENIGTSDSNGSNEFALLLAGIIPFMIPFLLKGRWYERLVCILCLPFLLNAFVLCNSRGAAVALIGAFIVSTFVVTEKEIRKKMILVGVVIVALVVYLADAEMVDRMSSLLRADDAISDDANANKLSSGRTEIWGYGINMVSDYPLGVGPNGFKHLARFYMPDEVLTYHPGAQYGVRSAHNSYLQVLVEQGFIGLVVWLIICCYTLLLIYKAFLKLKKEPLEDTFWPYCVFSMGVSFISILLGSLFNSRVYYEFFWWQVAMTVLMTSMISEVTLDCAEKIKVNDVQPERQDISDDKR